MMSPIAKAASVTIAGIVLAVIVAILGLFAVLVIKALWWLVVAI